MNTPGTGVSGYVLLLTIQFVLLVIFGVYTDYDDGLRPRNGTQAEEGFIIPKYARKSDRVYVSRDVAAYLSIAFAQTFKTFTWWFSSALAFWWPS